MRVATAMVCGVVGLWAAAGVGADEVALEDETSKTLYAIGVGVAGQLAPLGLEEAEIDLVFAGIRDAIAGREPRVSMEEYGPKIRAMAQARMNAAAVSEKEAARAFGEKMASEEGSEVTDSGLIYTELVAGEGASPGPEDKVRVHYHGTLRDGTVFDSSVDRDQPIELGLNQVIPCWTEGVQKMKVGGKSRLVCPSDIAYGDQGRPPVIPGGATLIFDVELLEILGE